MVFYDYDELSALTDVTFREIPPPRDDDEALSDTPWFSVGDRDVFPEEHKRFLGLSPELTRVFHERHGDLFEVEPWKAIQKRLAAGELMEIFPYADEARLPQTEDVRGW